MFLFASFNLIIYLENSTIFRVFEMTVLVVALLIPRWLSLLHCISAVQLNKIKDCFYG